MNHMGVGSGWPPRISGVILAMAGITGSRATHRDCLWAQTGHWLTDNTKAASRLLSGRSTAACGVPKADIAHGLAKRKPITPAYMFEPHPVRHFGKNRERRFSPTSLLWWLPASSTGYFCCP